MVCIPAYKILFLGSKSVQDVFLSEIQKLGIGEFNLGPIDQNLTELYQTISKSISILNSIYPLADDCMESFSEDQLHSSLTFAYEIINNQDEENLRKQKRKELFQELQVTIPFGSFSYNELNNLSQILHTQFMFLEASLNKIDAQNLPFGFYEVSCIGCMWYGISFGYSYPEKPFKKLDIRHDIVDLNKEISSLDQETAKQNSYMCSLSKEKGGLLLAAKRFLNNKIAYMSAAESIEIQQGAFQVFVWIDSRYMENVEKLSEKLMLYWEKQEVSEGEIPPTILHNEGYSRLGQDLVEIYDTPSVSDKDPSLWVLGSFAIFFAMIMGDMGYGIIILLISFYAERQIHSKDPAYIRFVRIGKILGMTTSIWGLLVGSFFGWNLPSRSYSLPYKLASAKMNYHILSKDAVWQSWSNLFPELEDHVESGLSGMTYKTGYSGGPGLFKAPEDLIDSVNKEISLVVGMIHLIISMLRGSYRSRTVWGWILFLIGGYVWVSQFLGAVIFPHYLLNGSPETVLKLGTFSMYLGLIIAHLFAIVERGWISGFLEWMNSIQLFSDVLSYLRIYALALSGAIIASTFNDISTSMPFPFAIICCFIGHTINFTLGLMGATVHGLRLNFLEWYRYSFEGGGRKFRPLFWK